MCIRDRRDAEPGERFFILVEDHLEPLLVGIVVLRAELGEAALEIVVHRKHTLDGVDLRVGVDAFLFLGGALAVVIVFGGEPQILVMLLGKLLGKALHLLHLLARDGEGLGLRFLLLILGGKLLFLLSLIHIFSSAP